MYCTDEFDSLSENSKKRKNDKNIYKNKQKKTHTAFYKVWTVSIYIACNATITWDSFNDGYCFAFLMFWMISLFSW